MLAGMETSVQFADVALQRPVRREWTYKVPVEYQANLQVGMRVAVPLGRRREIGVVVRLSAECKLESKRVRAIATVLDEQPVVDQPLLDLTRWMADYYACAWGEALGAVLPAALKRERGKRMLTVVEPAPGVGVEQLESLETSSPKQHIVLRTLLEASGPMERPDLLRKLNLTASPLNTLIKKGLVSATKVEAEIDELLRGGNSERVRPEQLTEDQTSAVEAITERLSAREFGAFLLYGVTGSGKTEVYLRVIEKCLAQGRGAIVLVPEIALTPQTVGWFQSRFESVAVLHSRMSDGQRLDMWQRVQRGDARVVVGARSAIFAPVKDLGVIVVDEEHEPSFKQGSTPRYHARDVAVVRAHRTGAVCLLGSATPSMESWVNAERGRYERLDLRSRVHGKPMPPVETVDMRLQRGKGPFSLPLMNRLRETLERKEQAILLLNRRGFSTTMWCKKCFVSVRCENCDVTLTYHRKRERMVCHACCEESLAPAACPSCTAPALKFVGEGSEKIELLLPRELPGVRVARMDSDTMLRVEDYENTLAAFGRGEIDVLVGTQMIAKGLDFPRVTLVGIIAADGALNSGDFRATERTFQLISQVSGRAGRGELDGRIVLQCREPEEPTLIHAARHDYEGFMVRDISDRKTIGFPPFSRIIRVVFEDEDEQRVVQCAAHVAAVLREHLAVHGVQVFGPSPAQTSMLRRRHRHNLLVKGPLEGEGMAHARGLLLQLSDENARPRIKIDVDPVNLM
ncbi:MAG: primosomal protein N' (replication factor Y) [Planctomycetota bacterium]|jgi:primosomal protein N' (replication factor Y)